MAGDFIGLSGFTATNPFWVNVYPSKLRRGFPDYGIPYVSRENAKIMASPGVRYRIRVIPKHPPKPEAVPVIPY